MITGKKFSLGLDFNDIMHLSIKDLKSFLIHASREEIIEWLQWNDPNGIYRDEQSLSEFGSICSEQEGIDIIINQICN